METPLEVYVRARVEGVEFALIALEEFDAVPARTDLVRTATGAPLPVYVTHAVARDAYAMAWTVASLAGMAVDQVSLTLLFLGSGTLTRFVARGGVRVGTVTRDVAIGKRG